LVRKTPFARLRELLDRKDEELEELRERAAELEREAEQDQTWTRHREHKQDLPPGNLPVPRLEIRWARAAGERLVADYSLVYRHLCDQIIVVPLGRTVCHGRPDDLPERGGHIELPFRDGAHIHHDMLQLGLPGFAIWEDKVRQLKEVPPHERT
jgi:hypothetical protein